MKDGKPVVNYGPMVVEFPKPGVLRILNSVNSGMFHAFRTAGAWEQDTEGKFQPVDFRFFSGKNPKTGQDNNFAGLKPVKDEVERSPSQLGRLRAILCLAGGLQAAEQTTEDSAETDTKPEAAGVSEEYRAPEPTVQLDTKSRIKRGEKRHSSQSRGKGRPKAEDEAPDLSRISTLADGQAAVGDEPAVGTETE